MSEVFRLFVHKQQAHITAVLKRCVLISIGRFVTDSVARVTWPLALLEVSPDMDKAGPPVLESSGCWMTSAPASHPSQLWTPAEAEWFWPSAGSCRRPQHGLHSLHGKILSHLSLESAGVPQLPFSVRYLGMALLSGQNQTRLGMVKVGCFLGPPDLNCPRNPVLSPFGRHSSYIPGFLAYFVAGAQLLGFFTNPLPPATKPFKMHDFSSARERESSGRRPT